MNIYITTIFKTFLSLLIQTYILYHQKEKGRLLFIMIFLVSYNFLFLVYAKYKSDVFKSRFLRRNYRPSLSLLIPFYTLELGVTIYFYYYLYKNMVYINIGLIVNMGILLVTYLQRIIENKTRKTCPLEKNEEFFKIAFLISNYKEDLKKGEVVQILDKKGENIIVRSSTGKKFTIPSKLVNDDIDLVI